MDSHGQQGPGLIGRTIGNYVVRQKLGEGGMGAVYLAEHPTIGKKVALKVLHAEFTARQEVVNRFFHEAKAVNDIQHPNIVDVIDFGILPAAPGVEPLVYFIMEFLGGLSLAELIRREAPLAPERALAIASQIADALAASHRKGIVHRDLKPDNVMLVQRGRDRDVVKLLDFGIAKLTGEQPAGSHKTRTGIVMGTPHYMSPEQCEGRGQIDARTDVYALGIVLYEMLCKQVPFSGEGYGEVLVQHLTMAPIPPRSLNAQIPPHVELVVLKALEKQPHQRYPNVDDMIAALGDPVGYVERHGGTAGFLSAPVLASNLGMPTIRLVGGMVTPPAMQPARGMTTLSASASETMPPPSGSRRRFGLLLGIGVIAMAIAGGAVAMWRGERGASEPVEPVAVAAPDAALTVTAPDAAAPAPTVVAAPAQVSISIQSVPPGAQVLFGAEKKPRGLTPYQETFDKAETLVDVKLVLKGHEAAQRTISLDRDASVDIELKKARPSKRRPARQGASGGENDIDDTMNPFEKGTP